jgi:5-methyltetrahydrofolate--homocysteine methyltransferase
MVDTRWAGEQDLSKSDALENVSKAITEFDIDKAKEMAEKAIEMKIPAYDIVTVGISHGLQEIGAKYENGEYFLSELILAGEAAKAVLEVAKLHFETQGNKNVGKLLIGTVEGDMHDIGKNLLAILAQGSGFEVYDLGVDISPKTFVERTRQLKPNVLGMSSLLSTTVPKFKVTVEALKKEGLRNGVKVIIGGVSASQKVADEYHVDAYETDAVAGLNRIREWMRI